MKTPKIVLAVTVIFSALMSGFFFAYSFSVNFGLHQLNNKAYLMAMQNINKEVLNPVFYSCFWGALLLLIISSILHFDIRSPKFYLILFACVSYTIGVFVVTGIRNVPLSNLLAVFYIANASEISLQNMRSIFEKSWVFWNGIRALASFAAVCALVISVVFFGSASQSCILMRQDLDE